MIKRFQGGITQPAAVVSGNLLQDNEISETEVYRTEIGDCLLKRVRWRLKIAYPLKEFGEIVYRSGWQKEVSDWVSAVGGTLHLDERVLGDLAFCVLTRFISSMTQYLVLTFITLNLFSEPLGTHCKLELWGKAIFRVDQDFTGGHGNRSNSMFMV